jgi:hypothetical protein
MSSTIGGNDEYHDFSNQEKDELEKELRAKARQLLTQKQVRERKLLLDKAIEISRRKSKKADHH